MTKEGISNSILAVKLTIISYDGLNCILSNILIMTKVICSNRTNIIYMTPSASRRLNTLCIMANIMAFFIISLFVLLYVRVDSIISLRGEARTHTNSLIQPLYIEVPASSKRSFIYVLGVSILSHSTIFPLYFVPTVWCCLFSIIFWYVFPRCGVVCFLLYFGMCSHGVVLFVFYYILVCVPTVWCCLFSIIFWYVFPRCGDVCFLLYFGMCSHGVLLLVFYYILVCVSTVWCCWFFILLNYFY